MSEWLRGFREYLEDPKNRFDFFDSVRAVFMVSLTAAVSTAAAVVIFG